MPQAGVEPGFGAGSRCPQTLERLGAAVAVAVGSQRGDGETVRVLMAGMDLTDWAVDP